MRSMPLSGQQALSAESVERWRLWTKANTSLRRVVACMQTPSYAHSPLHRASWAVDKVAGACTSAWSDLWVKSARDMRHLPGFLTSGDLDLTFDLSTWNAAAGYSCPGERSRLVFLCLFVLELGAHNIQTDGQTNGWMSKTHNAAY